MEAFLIILLIVVGYFVSVVAAMTRVDNKRVLSKLALIILVIYGCVIGMLVVVGQYLGEIGLLFYGLALFYSVIFLLWKVCWLLKVRPRIQISTLVIFISYIFAVLYITTFMRETGTNHRIQMEVLNWLREDGMESFDHIFLNMAMFVPLGVLFPFITEKYRGQMLSSVSFGILFSTAIETGQLFLHSGTCDIDDILSNSLGALVGTVIAAVGLWLKKNVRK